MNISYENSYYEPITAQEVTELSEYQVIYTPFDSKLQKKIEYYNNNTIYGINYFLDDDESEADAVSELLTFGCNFSITIREYTGSYTIENENSYGKDGIIVSKGRGLYNADGLQICCEELDIQTGLPDYQFTKKMLGDMNDDTIEHYCLFYYNADGSLLVCGYNYFSEYDSQDFDIAALPAIKKLFVLSDDMYNYYTTADFMPPV